ncbi:FtsK/SpoIIIE domain-containing protein [Streptomyces sp. MAR4 CNX-425]|uniref:FtsK/SpoIIIE domain-containing protein n=1 Tax=Streptomyces sp. MAR4 CNX-425 TaxID=3406343 RepID=UPI003B5135D2
MAAERMLTVVLPDGAERDVVLEAPDSAPVREVVAALVNWVDPALFSRPVHLADGTELPLDVPLSEVPVRPGSRIWLGRPPAKPNAASPGPVVASPDAVHRALLRLGLAEPGEGGTLLLSRSPGASAAQRRPRGSWRRLLPGGRQPGDPPLLAVPPTEPGKLMPDPRRAMWELWRRRPSDDDFLRLYLGHYRWSRGHHSDDLVGFDPVGEPVGADLRRLGVIGIAADDGRHRIAAWAAAQIATLHSPADVDLRVLTLGGGEDDDAWAFLRWLPRTAAGPRVSRDARTHAGQVADLLRRLDDRLDDGPRPATAVLMLDGARQVGQLPGVPELLSTGPDHGVLTICLDDHPRLLPAACRRVFDARDLPNWRTPDAWVADRADPAWSDRVGRILAPLRDPASVAEPDSPGLLDLIELPDPRTYSLRASRGLRPRGLSARVGKSRGEPVSIDLVRDGPHALVAGTTGSGKTEFLRTWISSMAVSHPPDALSFLLVDYKGGTAFGECALLPHTVDVLADLDGYLVERTLAGLAAELRRREELLMTTEMRDIGEYTDRYAAGDARAPDPLPRLVLVVDEAAALLSELPDFVRGLLDIARRGRSLGVHLVLATQRPAAVATAQVRATTNLRIALRVAGESDSADVIDAPDAAWLSASEPGLAYVRTGAETLVRLRTARVGVLSAAGPGAGPLVRVRGADGAGDEDGGGSLRVEPDPTGRTDLAVLVDAVRGAARTAGVPGPTPLLPPPLREEIDLDALSAGRPSPDAPPEEWPDLAPVPIGLADVPGAQRQERTLLDLSDNAPLFVVGGPGSGRSQFLRTVAGAVARRHSTVDVHLYGIDCGAGALQALTELPHCGAVVSRNEPDRLTRLLDRLTTTVRARESQLAAEAFPDVVAQRQAVATHRRLPYLLVLLDGYEGFLDALEDVEHGKPVEDFTRLCREGPRVGVHPVVAGGRAVLSARIRKMAAATLVLPLGDRHDYGAAGINPRRVPDYLPPGRALSAQGRVRVVLQIALLPGDPTARGQAEALARIGAAARERDADVPRTRRPFRVDALDLAADRFHVGGGTGRPVGRDAELAWLRDRYATGTSVALLGPRRAGKTWVLGELERRLVADGARRVRKLTVPHRASPVDSPDELAALLDPAVRGAASPADALLTRAGEPAARADREAFLLDEVGRLAEYHPAAVSWLRDLGQAGAWLVYTGTEKDWHTVVRSALTAPGSSFGNDVDKRILGPLGEPHALAFLTGTAANLGVDIEPGRAGTRILALVGTWPFYLQVMGDAVVRAVQADDRDPLTSGAALEELRRQELLIGRGEQFQSRWAEIGPAGRAALLQVPGEPPPEPAPAQRMELRDVGLLRPGDEWLADRPFFDWIALSQVSLRDESSHTRAAGPRTDEESAP